MGNESFLKDAILNIFHDKPDSCIGIRMTSGDILFGSLIYSLPKGKSNSFLEEVREIKKEGVLGPVITNRYLHLFTMDCGGSVFEVKIPIDSIDCLYRLPALDAFKIESKEDSLFKQYGIAGTFTNEIETILAQNSAKNISKLGLQYRTVVKLPHISTFPSVLLFPRWGHIEPNGDLPIYFDKTYFTDLAEKSDQSVSVGISTFFFSIGVNHKISETSEKLYRKKLIGSVQPFHALLEEIQAPKEVILEGCIGFFNPEQIFTMEDDEWILGFVSPIWIPTGGLTPDHEWGLVAFRKRCFLSPFELVERIKTPAKIYGEILPIPRFDSEYGQRHCLLKMRAASVIR